MEPQGEGLLQTPQGRLQGLPGDKELVHADVALAPMSPSTWCCHSVDLHWRGSGELQ